MGKLISGVSLVWCFLISHSGIAFVLRSGEAMLRYFLAQAQIPHCGLVVFQVQSYQPLI